MLALRFEKEKYVTKGKCLCHYYMDLLLNSNAVD